MGAHNNHKIIIDDGNIYFYWIMNCFAMPVSYFILLAESNGTLYTYNMRLSIPIIAE